MAISSTGVRLSLVVRIGQEAFGTFGTKPGFEVNGQVGDNNQDAVLAVAEVLNQFGHGFTDGSVPEYAEAFSGALNDLMAKHWPQGT